MKMLKTGDLIKQLRKEKGITQAQLAEQFGCTQHAVSQWETGKRVLDEQTFQAVLDFLGSELSVVKKPVLGSLAYRLEASDYIGEAPDIQILTEFQAESGNRAFTLTVERLGLRLIVPSFEVGVSFEADQLERDVLNQFGFDYAVLEDCPTFFDYVHQRGLFGFLEPSPELLQEYQCLQADMEKVRQLFSDAELADMCDY